MRKLKTVLGSYLIAASMAAACYDAKKVPPCEPSTSSWPDPCTLRLGEAGTDGSTREGGDR